MQNTIKFYNHFHNGDIFVSRGFITDIIKKLPDFNFEYHHKNAKKTTDDFITYGEKLNGYNSLVRFVPGENELAINTWIGAYNDYWNKEPPHFWEGGINYVVLHRMWKYIVSVINDHFKTDIELSDCIESYIPEIDYGLAQLEPIKQHLSGREGQKRILFSNGVPMSGQSFIDDMGAFINQFAQENPDVQFYVTKRIFTDRPNILCTDDFNINGSDLIEISYLSKYCDLVVGKNSGPFIYCLTRENMMDPTKKFLSFNHVRHDSLDWGVNIKCDFAMSETISAMEIFELIENKIKAALK